MLADIYVLTSTRSAALVRGFLNRFLPNRAPAATEYEVPQYAARPDIVLKDAAELISLCETRPDLEHAIYWNHRDFAGEPRAAHVFFLADGGLIFGLSFTQREIADEDRWLKEMLSFVGSSAGYIAYEQPPVRTIAAFHELVASRK